MTPPLTPPPTPPIPTPATTPTREIVCAGPAATKAVGAAIARTLLPGDVLLLDGDLGAGKTTFTQGLARAMGVRDPVTSPTFTLMRSYPTSFGVELIHADVYRLDRLFDIVSLGLPEMLENGAVAAIEWGGRAAPALGPEHLDVRLTLTETEGERLVSLRPSGSRWQARWPDLMAAVEGLGVGGTMTVLLGIATATSQVGVALSGPDGPLAVLQVRQGRRHAELLAPSIETLTRLAGIGVQQVGRVAVDVGPGLFTGLRVGVATAKALAAALDIPIVGCSSLELLAHPHRRQDRLVAAVVDAKRGEVFWRLYRPRPSGSGGHAGLTPLNDPTVSGPKVLVDDLAELAERGPVLAVGEGARRYADALGTLPNVELAGPGDDHPSPTVLVEVAAVRPSVPLNEITPLYLRGADVRIGWERRPDPAEPRG